MAIFDGILVSLSGIFYLFVGLTLDYYLPLTVALIIISHSASGGNWVLSTVLTQSWVEDEGSRKSIFHGHVDSRYIRSNINYYCRIFG